MIAVDIASNIVSWMGLPAYLSIKYKAISAKGLVLFL